MGLLSGLFGEDKKTSSMVKLSGNGAFSTEIVGESHYQRALENICRGRTYDGQEKKVEASLIHDDGNPYDNQAIRVEIQGQIVGHLNREMARKFRKRMMETGHAGVNVTCAAKIVGGWEREETEGDFGVKLDLPLDYFSQASHATPLNDTYEKDAAGSQVFTFDISGLKHSEVSECQINYWVNLWIAPKDIEKIFIYRMGEVGGAGRLGSVPDKYFEVIASHLDRNLPYEATIIELTADRCRIRCKLVSQEEINLQQEKERQKLEIEISKKYIPKKMGFEVFIEVLKDSGLKDGQLILIDKAPIDFSPEYIPNHPPMVKLKFVDESGKVVAFKWNEQEKIKRMLRARNSGYQLVIWIQSIDRPEEWKIPSLTHFHATATVHFEKHRESTGLEKVLP